MVCVYYRIDDASEDVASVDTLDLSLLNGIDYINAAVKNSIPHVFLKSESYTSVLDWIEKDLPLPMSCSVKIYGPKGSGKMLCLLALMSKLKSLYSDIEPVFVSSISFEKDEQAKTSSRSGAEY